MPERLGAIEMFSTKAEATFAFDELLAGSHAKVAPNLTRSPRIGRDDSWISLVGCTIVGNTER